MSRRSSLGLKPISNDDLQTNSSLDSDSDYLDEEEQENQEFKQKQLQIAHKQLMEKPTFRKFSLFLQEQEFKKDQKLKEEKNNENCKNNKMQEQNQNINLISNFQQDNEEEEQEIQGSIANFKNDSEFDTEEEQDTFRNSPLKKKPYILQQSNANMSLRKAGSSINDEEDQQVIIEILKQKEKTNTDKQYIQKALLHLPMFSDKEEIFLKSKDTLDILLKEIRHEHFRQNDEIISYGDFGNCYYIILRGSCYVLAPDENQTHLIKKERKRSSQRLNIQQLDDNKMESLRRLSFNSTSSNQNKNKNQNKEKNNRRGSKCGPSINQLKNMLQQSDQNQVNIKNKENNKDSTIKDQFNGDEKLNEKYKYFNLVATLNSGKGFGEIALITKQRRTATIVAKEDSDFLVLSREGYNKIFSQYQEQILIDKMNFYKQFSFFQHIPKSKIMAMILESEIQRYQKNSTIYSYKNSINKIYFIKQGEVEMFQEVLIENNQNNNKFELTLEKQNKLSSKQQISKLNQVELNKNKKNQKKKVSLGILGPNCYFGDKEIIQKNSKRQTEVISLTHDTIIYSFKKEVLLMHLNYWNTFTEFQNQGQQKIQYHEQRINQAQNAKDINSKKFIK